VINDVMVTLQVITTRRIFLELASMKIFILLTGNVILPEIECDTDILLKRDKNQYLI